MYVLLGFFLKITDRMITYDLKLVSHFCAKPTAASKSYLEADIEFKWDLQVKKM